MRTFRLVVVLVGILVGVDVAGLAEAQTVGPLCATIVGPGGSPNFGVQAFLLEIGGDQFTLTGFDVTFNRPLSGSAVLQGNTSFFQLTVGANETTPTLFISGTVNLSTGDGTGICARNVLTTVGCGEGVPVVITNIPC